MSTLFDDDRSQGSLAKAAARIDIQPFPTDAPQRNPRALMPDSDAPAFVQALRQTQETVMLTDARGTIRYVNPAFEQTTGMTALDVAGRTPRVLKSGLHEPDFYARLWRTLRSGGTFSGSLVNRRADGSTYRQFTTICPVTTVDGRITHYVATGRPCDQGRPGAAAVAAMPLHAEVRAPDTGLVEIVDRTGVVYLGRARNPAVPAAAADDAVTLTRISTSVRALLLAAASHVRSAAAECGIAVCVDAVSGDARARIDPGRMMQLLHLLLRTAVRCADGPGLLALGARCDRSSGDDWVFEVRTEGFRLRPAAIDAAFATIAPDGFLPPAPEPDIAVCRQIVAAHGGSLARAILPDGTTCLTVMLPDP